MKSFTQINELKKQHIFSRFLTSRTKLIIECIAALFILLFFYTALNKTLEIDKTVVAIWQTPGLSKYATAIAWTIVIFEYIVTIMLFIPNTRKLGLYASLFMMLSFTAYIIYMKTVLNDLPCSCGGVISKMSWNQHLLFNIVLSILGFFSIYLIRIQPRAN